MIKLNRKIIKELKKRMFVLKQDPTVTGIYLLPRQRRKNLYLSIGGIVDDVTPQIRALNIDLDRFDKEDIEHFFADHIQVYSSYILLSRFDSLDPQVKKTHFEILGQCYTLYDRNGYLEYLQQEAITIKEEKIEISEKQIKKLKRNIQK